MCGIAGAFQFGVDGSGGGERPDAAVLEAMAARMAHRGPDDAGVECGPGWGLAHRRLSILGVATGHQPMTNEDRTVWIAFNGEIYNYTALRAELQQHGHRFDSDSDTAVLLHGYEQWGAEGLLQRIAGMFAFAIADTASGRLTLARDRLGQKPLMVGVAGGWVVFASELQALLQWPGIDTGLNVQGLHDYLSLMYVPAPATIYRGVRKLPPGCLQELATTDHRMPEPRPYWRPAFAPTATIPYADAVARTRELLETAVTRRLQSEVPLGAFLSGGIDSSAVVGLMRRVAGAEVQTFTIGFEDPAYDETGFAELVARELGTEHRTRRAEPRDVALLRTLIRNHGEPYCDASMIPTALLSRFTREHVTVALSGDAADELFGGYQRYQVMALGAYLEAVPRPLRRGLAAALLRLLPADRDMRTRLGTLRRLLAIYARDGVEAYGVMHTVFSETAKQQLYDPETAEQSVQRTLAGFERILAECGIEDRMGRYMALDLQSYLPGDVLAKVDIATMAFGLEARSPFLDHDLVDFVTRLPRRYKAGLRYRKRLLIDAVADVLPEAIKRRGKRGFGVPVAEWLRGSLRPMLEEMAADTSWNLHGLLAMPRIGRMVREHVAGTHNHAVRLWALLCYRLWVEER